MDQMGVYLPSPETEGISMTIPKQGFEALLHSLMPARLREELKPNTAAYIRARALTAMLFNATVLAALFALVFVGSHLVSGTALLKHDLVPFGILLLLVLQIWMFYRHGNYWISGLAFTNFYFLGIVLLIILAGGYEFHGKSLLLTCPMMSFVIGSRQEGIQNALLSIVFFCALVFLYSIEFSLPNIFYVQDQHIIFLVNWTFTIATITITLLVYETELQGRRTHTHLRANHMRDRSQLEKRVEAYYHNRLPAGLRNSLDRQSIAYTRVRILTILLRMATILCFMSAFLILGIDLVFQPAQFKYDTTILAIALCFALQTWLFYKFNNPGFSGTLLAYFTFVVIVGVVLVSGGYESPVMALLLVCPVGFFMISGIREGVISAVLIAMTGIVLCYLNKGGFRFIDFFHDAAPHITSAIVWFVVIMAIMTCMMAYDTELEKL
jgi:hypothetical protein